MKENFLKRHLINRLSKDTIAYQAVLGEIPFNLRMLYKGILNGLSITRSGKESTFPMFLCIESSSKCNLKCPMCPRTDLLTRETGNMDYELYKTIFDSVKPVFITLSQFGEPLIHPKIIDMISYARQKGASVRVTTNATLLNQDMSYKIIKAGLTHFQISFDSCSKELYEKNRAGAIFEKVVGNIKTLLSLKKELNCLYPIVSFNMTLNKDNIHEITEMIRFCIAEFGIPPTFTKMYTYGEAWREGRSLDDSSLAYIKQGYIYAKSCNFDSVCKNLETIYKDIASPVVNNRPCFFPYYTTSVTWDGKVYPCCIYFDEQITFGDLTKQSFKQIWNGDIYQGFRKKLRENRDAMPLCHTCSLIDIGLNNMISKHSWIRSLVNIISKRKFIYIQRDNNLG